MEALKYKGITVYPVANSPGKKDGLSQVVIRIHSKAKSLTLPVTHNNKPIKVVKSQFIDWTVTGGFSQQEINYKNSHILRVWQATFEAVIKCGLDYEAIKRTVYGLKDPLTITIEGEENYIPAIQDLGFSFKVNELSKELQEKIVEHLLAKRGVTKDSPNYDLSKWYTETSGIYEAKEIAVKITDQELNSFEKKESKKAVTDYGDMQLQKLHSVVEDRKEPETPIERYQKEDFNDKNIFDLFGWCRFGRIYNKAMGDYKRRVPESYDPILINLIDYRINAKPKEHVKDLNYEWVQDFLI